MNGQNEDFKKITPNLPLWFYQLQRDSKLVVKTRNDLEVHLITRALKDEGFWQEMLVNPKAVVENELGTKLPEGLEIHILEETETTLFMVLPNNPYEKLSEQELQASLGMTYEDVAEWVLEQQRNNLLDETSSVTLMARAWRDEAFKQQLLLNPKEVIEQELSLTLMIENVELQVFAEDVNTIYIVRPHRNKPLAKCLGDIMMTDVVRTQSPEAKILHINRSTPSSLMVIAALGSDVGINVPARN